MGFAPHELKDRAFAALEEAAERARAAPAERSRAIAFALAFLWAHAGGDRTPYLWFWRALAMENDIARRQNLAAALNALRHASPRS